MKAILSVGLTSIHNLPVYADQWSYPCSNIDKAYPFLLLDMTVCVLSALSGRRRIMHTPFYILVHISWVYTDSHRR
jgi:hypothetical protein